ncbi:hypothetical protein ALC53_11685 [Atta colombica]|uniref:Uncharacterized protein n=1 Tax=Atta colombica TaxID=520822 RepID=A0A195B056_9HYME|nr:hypothetical protein ALC53_11685 [Atta colombica]
MQSVMQRYDNIKINTVFNGEFVSGDKEKSSSDLQEWYASRVVESILTSLEEFQERDSGWTLSRVLNLGCRIELPREIKIKRAVVNVRSMDNLCFIWSVVAALHPARSNTDRTSLYPLSEDDKWLSFSNHCRKERIPFEYVTNIGYYAHCSYYNSLSIYRFRHDNDCIACFSLCEKPFALDDIRVCDYCHLPGDFTKHIDSIIDKNDRKKTCIKLIIECGIRGGLSQCSNRYAQTNNTYMKSNRVRPCLPTGYVFEIDLEYKKSHSKREEKLLRTLYDKKNYVIHYRNLQQYTRHEGRYGVETMFAKPNFHSRSVFSENLVAIEMWKLEMNFDKYVLPLFHEKYKIKIPGLMKDENNGAKINIVMRSIMFNDYQSCIRSKLHQVYITSETKIVLSPYDDKRYIVPDSTDTLHEDITKYYYKKINFFFFVFIYFFLLIKTHLYMI